MATSDNSVAQHPSAQPPAFAELHCLSNYSFLRGASHPEELVKQAHALGYKALAITDECTYAGLVKAHLAAKACGLQLIIGAEFDVDLTPAGGPPCPCKLVVLATSRETYGQLAGLISKLRRRADKGEYQATLEDMRWGLQGCLVLWPLGVGEIGELLSCARLLQEVFADLWIALELFRDGHDLDKTANALTLAMRLDLPIVATNNVHTHSATRQPLQDVLTAIRHRMPVSELGSRGFANAERTLRPLSQLAQLYPPEMLAESMHIASRCHFSMDELRYEYPEDLVPPHLSATDYLRQLTMRGAQERWPEGIPRDTLVLIEKELAIISELQYEHYFLTVQDIVQFARSQNILCQGRGSAANSAVCYCLHVTEVDPARMHLLFERFVSKERNEPPDIDVDFEHERREEVIQYIYKRYGRGRAALAATLVTYRPRSAIRDVGKALGLDLDVIDLLAKSMAWWDKKEEIPARLRAAGLDPDSQVAEQFLFFVNEILGFPRHLSQHVGGFVISRGPLAQLVPIENAAMEDRTVIQWDKDDLEALGLLKIDVLALGMLTAIRKTLQAINGYRGTDLNIQKIPAEDPATYHMLQQGDSVGVFQVESRAQMSMLPRLKPQHFYDLVIEVAIVRPGPIQGDMVHPYLRRRQGLEPVQYPSAGVRKVLERTLGVPIFQEQVIELAMVAAGFTAGEADQLRRAMAAWKRRGGLESFEKKLIDGMLARGHDEHFAQRVFKQIQGFGEYGFPESHAASFALLVYISAWLKRHEPAAFFCGLLNSLPMGFYSPSQLIQDAQRHGIEVREIDVTRSHWSHTLEVPRNAPGTHKTQPALRLGLRMVKGLSEEVGLRIETAIQGLRQHEVETPCGRSDEPESAARARHLHSVQDLAEAADLNDQNLRFLARAGALRSLLGHRHQAHWEVAGLQRPLPIERPRHTNTSAPQAQQDIVHKDLVEEQNSEPALSQPAQSSDQEQLRDRIELPEREHPAGRAQSAQGQRERSIQPQRTQQSPLQKANPQGHVRPQTPEHPRDQKRQVWEQDNQETQQSRPEQQVRLEQQEEQRQQDKQELRDKQQQDKQQQNKQQQQTSRQHQSVFQRQASPPDATLSTDDGITLPAPSRAEDLLDDYRYTGLTLGPHPMQLLRTHKDFDGFRTATDLPGYRQGQPIRIAGLVTGRQRPGTATGVVFLTLEDETGNINVIVWSSVLQRFRAALLQGQLLKIKGVVERESKVIHVVAGHVENATHHLQSMMTEQLPFKSRDFH